jgi:hypothetical protein
LASDNSEQVTEANFCQCIRAEGVGLILSKIAFLGKGEAWRASSDLHPKKSEKTPQWKKLHQKPVGLVHRDTEIYDDARRRKADEDVLV